MITRYFSIANIFLLPLAVLILPQISVADTLAQPVGKVILTVSGNINVVNVDGKAKFDRKMLEALGESELSLETPWTDGKQHFTGVLGSKILDAVGAKGNTLIARAINDYQVEIPISDLRKYPVLFALQQNGSYMRVREKGPIWIIYPRETHPDLDVDELADRWVWQLSEILVQ